MEGEREREREMESKLGRKKATRGGKRTIKYNWVFTKSYNIITHTHTRVEGV